MVCDSIDTGQLIETSSRSFRLGYNIAGTVLGADDAAFPSLTPRVTEPNNVDIPGIVTLGDNFCELIFMLALAGANESATAQVRITRYERVSTPDGRSALWVPIPMVVLDLATGTQTGVASSIIPAGLVFCSTAGVATSSEYDKGYDQQTDVPTGLIGAIRLDHRGTKYLHVGFALGSITPTAEYGNFLIKTY